MSIHPYSLSLYTGVLDPGHTFAASLTRDARNWRRAIRSIGGYWQGSFTLAGDPATLQHHFDNWLGYHLVERYGSMTTYEGLIYEMEYSHMAMRRVRSLDMLGNATRVAYVTLSWDGSTWHESDAYTTWATSAESIARYGRREYQLRLNCQLTTAELVRANLLSTYAWPWPRPVGSLAPGAPVLTVRVCGYAFTANWMYLNQYDYLDHNASDWVTNIVGTTYGLSLDHGGAGSTAGDCQFLKTGTIQSNTLQITEAPPGLAATRAWRQLAIIAGIGDATSHPWQLQVDTGRVVNYHALDLAPRYWLRGGALYDTLAAQTPVPPWLVRPAVVRDLSYPATATEPGSFLTDARDTYIEEVEAFNDGRLALKTALFGEADLMAAQLDQGARWPRIPPLP